MMPVLNILQSHLCLAGALKHYAAQTRDPEPQSLMVMSGSLLESAQNTFWISLLLGLNVLSLPWAVAFREFLCLPLFKSHLLLPPYPGLHQEMDHHPFRQAKMFGSSD